MITDVLILFINLMVDVSHQLYPLRLLTRIWVSLPNFLGKQLARLDQTLLSDPISCCQGVDPQSKIGPEHHQQAQICYNMKEICGKGRIIQDKFQPKRKKNGQTIDVLCLKWTDADLDIQKPMVHWDRSESNDWFVIKIRRRG